MQKARQLICLIVFLVLVATSCTTRTVMDQAEVDDRLIHLIKKRFTTDDCTRCRSTYLPPCYRDTCDAHVCADVCRTPDDDCTRCRSTYLPPCYRDACDAHVCADVCGSSK